MKQRRTDGPRPRRLDRTGRHGFLPKRPLTRLSSHAVAFKWCTEAAYITPSKAIEGLDLAFGTLGDGGTAPGLCASTQATLQRRAFWAKPGKKRGAQRGLPS